MSPQSADEQQSVYVNDTVTFLIDGRPKAKSICDLREAVSFRRNEEDYPTALDHYDTTVSAYDEEGTLIGWCAVVTDGVRHGFFVDVVVHPQWQRRGIGRSLIQRAIDRLRGKGITLIHADFAREHAPFYERCGFRIGLGDIYEQ